jgi:succinate dehydrogenase / fumarate reductase membrane anchor subunit
MAMVNRVFTHTYGGTRNWLLQRLTAVVMSLYLILLGALLVVQHPAQYDKWKAMFNPLWLRIATLLFLFSLFIHAWLGIRDIFRDYVHALALRNFLQWVTTLALIAYSVWSAKILWGIH